MGKTFFLSAFGHIQAVIDYSKTFTQLHHTHHTNSHPITHRQRNVGDERTDRVRWDYIAAFFPTKMLAQSVKTMAIKRSGKKRSGGQRKKAAADNLPSLPPSLPPCLPSDGHPRNS